MPSVAKTNSNVADVTSKVASLDLGAVTDLMTKLSTEVSEELVAEVVSKVTAESWVSLNFTKLFTDAATSKKSAELRQNACAIFASLASAKGVKHSVFPHLIENSVTVMELLADKNADVKKAAKTAVKKFTKLSLDRPYAAPALIETLYSALQKPKFQTKVAALDLLKELIAKAPVQMAAHMHTIIPNLVEMLWDTKDKVCDAAYAGIKVCFDVISNKDLEPFIPSLISAMKSPEEVPKTIEDLAATTFVQTVSGAALSIIAPVLERGLKGKNTALKRQCGVIVANMSKLVELPLEALPFALRFQPMLERAATEIADPEARAKCDQGVKQLQRIQDSAAAQKTRPANFEESKQVFVDAGKGAVEETVLGFIGHVATTLGVDNVYDAKAWNKNLLDALKPLGSAAQGVVDAALAVLIKNQRIEGEEEEDGDNVLCNCKFTLAYGSKILLHNTDMKLLRGHKYGLLGPNDSGKTTLMRAIDNEQVDGFPPKSELRTVFVEADIIGEQSHLNNVDYILADPRIAACGATREQVKEKLLSVEFTEKMLNDEVSTLSGGWRMKLALARAMLQNADILLMDEPTNHLDVINVAWVEDYLLSLKDVTCIIVSHDSGLLNKVCTDIIQIDSLKLNFFKGNLSAFVEKVPEAQSYFKFTASKLKFKFPQPAMLTGVKSKGRALLKMDNITFTYPGNEKPTITDVTVRVSLSSRVACVGRNGAGKSTMIKLLTGELIPDEGSGNVWKHQGVRIGYIAQHAFHHLERHLDQTANEYIRWRYQFGEDKEGLEKVTMVVTDEERAALDVKIEVTIKNAEGAVVKKEKRTIDELTGNRRQTPNSRNPNDFEYEVTWKGMRADAASWERGERLEKLGWSKFVKAINEKIAAAEGLYRRALTVKNVEEHLEDVGLDREFGTHNRIKALSGGQKVKVVLAASMWNQPHILILDEPTNYLDRESLGALAGAIEEYEGGVVMITHNNEFCSQLCPETWVLENGTLDCRGDAEWMTNAMKEKVEFKAMETMVDAYGNEVKVKQEKKKLSRREAKQKAKDRKMRKARGEEVSDSEEED